MNGPSVSVLLADDDESFRRVQEYQLTRAGYDVTACADGEAALEAFRSQPHDVVVTDVRMPGVEGLELLAKLRALAPDTPVVVVTAHGTIETAVEAMRRGAFDFLTKPFPGDQLRLTLERALEMSRLVRENRELRRAVDGRLSVGNLVGSSPAMRKMLQTLELAAPTPSTVLITGETGTGKELVARAVHHNSLRRDGPFVTVNCGALPGSLIEAELFGYRRGAFTGAVANRAGKFEAADGGTIFLDEVGELPPELQPKILRVIQTGEVDRLGEDRPIRVDVRILSATNRDLSEMVAERVFREDLYYRLAVVPLHVPPLRDRREDIPLLVETFIERMERRTGRSGLKLPPAAMRRLERHSWPGNVRELENLIERLVVLSREPTLDLDALPEMLDPDRVDVPTRYRLPPSGVHLDDVERDLIRQALDLADGNRSQAARLLGVTRNTLLYRMQKHGLR